MSVNDIKYIEKLIDAFYEGATSPFEEEILYKFFSKQDIPARLRNEKKFFMELASLKQKKMASSLARKLDQLIDKLEAEESIIGASQKRPVVIKQLNWRWITAVAASLLILLSAGIYTFHSGRDAGTEVIIADTYEDPEEAYIETQKTLLYVSNKLNKGFGQVESAKKNLEKTSKIVEKNIQL